MKYKNIHTYRKRIWIMKYKKNNLRHIYMKNIL